MIIKAHNQLLYCSIGNSNSDQTISGSLIPLSRIQDYSLDISYPYYQGTTLSNQAISQSISRSTATLGLNYYPTDLRNELIFGFNLGTGQCVFSNLNQEKNIFIRFSKFGYDGSISNDPTDYCLGLGNGIINSYSLSTAIGNPLQSNINWEFLNVQSYTGCSGQNVPTFNHETQEFNSDLFTLFAGNSLAENPISIIKDRDITLSFSTGTCMGIQLTGADSCYVQNFNLALNFDRSQILELGKKYPTERNVLYPINFDFSTEVVMNGLTEDNVSEYFCENKKYNILLNCRKQIGCTGSSSLFDISINGLKLERQTFNANLSGPNTVSLSFKGLIANSFDLDNNIWISILQVGGKLGLLLDTELLYSYRDGTASLCGFNEYTDASIPPKKYRLLTTTGSLIYYCSSGESGTKTQNGTSTIDKNTCIQTNFGLPSYNAPCICACGCDDLVETKTISQMFFRGSHFSVGFCCGSQFPMTLNGSSQSDLSDEDTELDAINRLLNSASWSPWQSTPIYSYYQQRTSGFNFLYREVRTKTITTEKYNPGINYKLSYTIQRRTYGSSDPFIDAETIQTQQKPNNSGDFEIDIENQSGYESKITNLTISL